MRLAESLIYQDSGVEIALLQGERIKLYRWGNPRPLWTSAFKGKGQAIAVSSRAIYIVTSTHLHCFPRRESEPLLSYETPFSYCCPTMLYLHETTQGTQFMISTTSGVLLRARLPEMKWQATHLSSAALQQGTLLGDYIVMSDIQQAYCVAVSTGRIAGQWQTGIGGVLSWASHPKGLWVAGGCADGLVKVWTAPDGKLATVYAGHRLYPVRLGVHPEGKIVVSYGAEGLLWFYDIDRRQSIAEQALQAPREVKEVLAIRWHSLQQIQLLTTEAFWECDLATGKWRSQMLK